MAQEARTHEVSYDVVIIFEGPTFFDSIIDAIVDTIVCIVCRLVHVVEGWFFWWGCLRLWWVFWCLS